MSRRRWAGGIKCATLPAMGTLVILDLTNVPSELDALWLWADAREAAGHFGGVIEIILDGQKSYACKYPQYGERTWVFDGNKE